ncbi:hypothetical protein AB0B48_07715 [Micromonospora sp. NPDC049089]|uniref:hypothetical protein n=1 Tax=unclassified Micromonospora TaxID=2617518 RepID=UPI0033E21243
MNGQPTYGVPVTDCDTVIAWTLLHGPSRAAFRAALGLDDASWARAGAGRCGRR